MITPFRGMLSTRNELIDELGGWPRRQSIDDVGPFFLRLHVIDMSGPMDLDIDFDRGDVAEGDRFACRYEAFRTDPRTEPRETKWEVELNIRIAEPTGSSSADAASPEQV